MFLNSRLKRIGAGSILVASILVVMENKASARSVDARRQCIATRLLDQHILELDTIAAVAAVVSQLNVATSGDLNSAPVEDMLVDGFTAEQWAAYARKKSAIASRKCKENGLLKAQLACASCAGCSRRSFDCDRTQEDPLFARDTWFSTTLACAASIREGISSAADAWSS